MGLLEDVQKATPPEEKPQSLLAQVQAASPEAEQLPAPELTDPGRPLEFEEAVELPALGRKRRGRARLALELGGGLAATGGVGGALSLGRMGFLALRAGAGEAAGAFAAESFDPSESPIARMGQAFRTGSLGEFAGGTLFRGGSKLFGGTVLEEGAETAIREITNRGGIVTPGLVSKNWAVDLLENVTEASITGGGRIRRVREKAIRLAQESVEEFSEGFIRNASKEDIGALASSTLKGNEDAFLAGAKDMFSAVDNILGGAPVSYQDVQGALRVLKKEAAAEVDIAATTSLIDDVLRKKTFVTFGEAQRLRSSLLRITRNTRDEATINTANKIAGLVDDAMDNAARSLQGGGPLEAWRTANAFWKTGKERFNDLLIKSLMKKEPEVVFQTAIRGQRPGSIRKVRAAVDDEVVWKDMQGQLLRDLMSKATDVQTGEMSGRKLLAGLKTFGDDTFDATFSKPQRETFRELVQSMALVQGKAAKGAPGGMLIQLTQGGAIIGLATGVGTAQSAAILGLPWAASHLLTRPKIAKALTLGLRAPPGSQEATRAFGQLSAIISRELFEIGEQDRAPRAPQRPGSVTLGGPRLPVGRPQ